MFSHIFFSGERSTPVPRPDRTAVPSRLIQRASNSPSPAGSNQQQNAHQQYRPRPQYHAQGDTFFPLTHPPGPLRIGIPPPGQKRSRHVNSSYPYPMVQASSTSYYSRMATGVTTLMQPINVTGGPPNSYGATTTFNGAGAGFGGWGDGRAGRATKPRINYAEVGEDEADEEMDDDEDVGKNKATTGGPELTERKRLEELKKKQEEEKRQESWSWLGERTPGQRVKGKEIRPLSLPHL